MVKLDTFSCQLQYNITKHKRSSLATDVEIVTKDAFTYSPQDRLLTQTHQINAGTIEVIANNTYDELGQLISKKVGNTIAAPTQKVDYTYNIRGWLTGINNTAALQQGSDPKDLFAFKINYNNTPAITGGKALYNGNIAETFWSSTSDATPIVRGYAYLYDNLNRLKTSVYKRDAVISNAYSENLTYDKNGNINSIIRNGNSETATQIDALVYTYAGTNTTNQLVKVVDNAPAASKVFGFTDSAANTVDDYSYDFNGNMTKDNNKNITAITYNHLNLPTKITFATTGNIVYIYNAAGQKVQKIVNEIGKSVVTTDYLGGYQYDNNTLKFFPTAEGYVEPSGSSYKYVYQYKDHLGNVRLSYDKTLVIKEESNFYPFGLKQEGYNTLKIGVENKYKYNGKELQDELGLGMYDYGMRNYDPALGRWMNIDPLAEKMRRYSPFTYALDNPIFFVDPDGMQATYNWEEHDKGNKGVYNDGAKTVSYQEALSQVTEGESNTNEGIDPPKKGKPSLVKQLLLAVPVLGATIESSDKMGEGDYLGAALSFGVGVMDLFTLGTANKYKTGTAGVIVGIEVTAEQTGKYGGLSVAEKYGIKSYSSLRTLIKGKSLQAHHLIEQRFASTLGVTPGSMSSIAVTAEEHQIFTNAWRTEIGYKGSTAITNTANATKEQIYNAARKVYKDYPEILKALKL